MESPPKTPPLSPKQTSQERMIRKLYQLHAKTMMWHYRENNPTYKFTEKELLDIARDCIYWMTMIMYKDQTEFNWGEFDKGFIGYLKYRPDGTLDAYQSHKRYRFILYELMDELQRLGYTDRAAKVLIGKQIEHVYVILHAIYPRIEFRATNDITQLF